MSEKLQSCVMVSSENFLYQKALNRFNQFYFSINRNNTTLTYLQQLQ
jgi:hypothetical protein